MSEEINHEHHHDTPKFEPWFGVMVAALVPMLLAFFVPRTYFAMLAAVAAALFVAGLTMMLRQGRKSGSA